jgi:hypothetical protein
MLRSWRLLGCLLAIPACLSWAQDRAETKSLSDVTLSVAGNETGLQLYMATMQKLLKERWIERWPIGETQPGRLVMRIRVNRAGYLGMMETLEQSPKPVKQLVELPGSERLISGFRDEIPERMFGSARDALNSVFVGLPPSPPESYPSNVITLQITFVFGTEKPKL